MTMRPTLGSCKRGILSFVYLCGESRNRFAAVDADYGMAREPDSIGSRVIANDSIDHCHVGVTTAGGSHACERGGP